MNALDVQRRDTKLNHARCSEQQSVLLILISNKLFMMLSLSLASLTFASITFRNRVMP